MKLTSILNRIIPHQYKELLRVKLGVPNQISSFERIKKLGFKPNCILDIGAYEGHWALAVRNVFTDSKILMIEGQQEKLSILENIKVTHALIDYRIALLGAEEKEINFNIYDTASSVLTEHHETGAKVEKRNLSVLDHLLVNTDFNRPDFIKIDTQGYELEILKGATETLKSAEFVLLEVSLLDIYKDVPLVNEVMVFMKEKGFVLYDICSLMRRPLDQVLFQSDFLFIKENSNFLANKKWS